MNRASSSHGMKVVVQVLPLSIGASVASAVFSKGAEGRTCEVEEQESGSRAPALNDLSATVAGAGFVGFSSRYCLGGR